MKNIYPDETYEGRNVLNQFNRLSSPRVAGIFFFFFIKRISDGGFLFSAIYLRN